MSDRTMMDQLAPTAASVPHSPNVLATPNADLAGRAGGFRRQGGSGVGGGGGSLVLSTPLAGTSPSTTSARRSSWRHLLSGTGEGGAEGGGGLPSSISMLSAEDLIVGSMMPVVGLVPPLRDMSSAHYTATGGRGRSSLRDAFDPEANPPPEGPPLPPCDPVILKMENVSVDVKVEVPKDPLLKRIWRLACRRGASEATAGDSLSGKEDMQPLKRILHNVNVTVFPCRLVALMGASGAGKSTLLNALSRRRVPTEGVVKYNDVAWTDQIVRGCSVFIQQQDVFISNLNVDEHLKTQLKMRLGLFGKKGKGMVSEREELLCNQMSLVKCRYNVIGQPGAVGSISGGERKRLNVASEIATLPSVLFADEPTTGLDSFMAASVMRILRLLSNSGRTIVATIHQPSSSIFEMFDDLLLLAEGRVIYFGDRLGCVEWLRRLGHECPAYTNPADFIVKLVSMPAALEEREAKLRVIIEWCERWKREGESFLREWMEGGGRDRFQERTQTLCNVTAEASFLSKASRELTKNASFQFGPQSTGVDAKVLQQRKSIEARALEASHSHVVPMAPQARKQLSWFRQVEVLYLRAAMANKRDRMLVHARLFQTIVISLVLGTMTLGIDWSEMGARSRMGGTYSMLMNQSMAGAYTVINTFSSEKPVAQREYESGLYHPTAYVAAKFLADGPIQIIFPIMFATIVYWMMGINPSFTTFLVFLVVLLLTSNVAMSFGYFVSIVAPTMETAGLLCNIIILPLTIYGGFMVKLDESPKWLSWIQYLSFLKWGFQAGLITVFRNTTIHTARGPIDGIAFVTEALGIHESQYALSFCMLVILLIIYRTIGLFSAGWVMSRKRENA